VGSNPAGRANIQRVREFWPIKIESG